MRARRLICVVMLVLLAAVGLGLGYLIGNYVFFPFLYALDANDPTVLIISSLIFIAMVFIVARK